MSRHRYSRAALHLDLLRGGMGLLVSATPIVVVQAAGWLGFALGLCAALFVVFLCTVLLRYGHRIEMDALALSVFSSPNAQTASSRLLWSELQRLDLDYFCTRRDGRGGWLQLRLRSGDGVLRLDSRLLGFERVLAQALYAARLYGVALSATTTSNLAAIGVDEVCFARGADDSGHERNYWYTSEG